MWAIAPIMTFQQKSAKTEETNSIFLHRIWSCHSGGHIFWDTTPRSPSKVNRRLGRAWLQGRNCYPLHAAFLLGLSFHPEDRGDKFLRNVRWYSSDYSALYPRRQLFGIVLCSLTEMRKCCKLGFCLCLLHDKCPCKEWNKRKFIGGSVFSLCLAGRFVKPSVTHVVAASCWGYYNAQQILQGLINSRV
jgi:hypothetical protein